MSYWNQKSGEVWTVAEQGGGYDLSINGAHYARVSRSAWATFLAESPHCVPASSLAKQLCK